MKPYKTDYRYTRVKYVPLREPGPNTDLRVIRRERPHRQPFSPSKVPRKTNQTILTPGRFAFIQQQIRPLKSMGQDKAQLNSCAENLNNSQSHERREHKISKRTKCK